MSAGEDDMESYENGQPHHAALPAAHSGAFPSPADYASLLHPDPAQTSQVISPSFPCYSLDRYCLCHRQTGRSKTDLERLSLL